LDLKETFQNREIEHTYAIGEKIAQSSIDNVKILIESKNLDDATKTYKNNSFYQKISTLFTTPKVLIEEKKRYKKINSKIKNIILIGERPIDARDNGYWLFRYIRENHPNVNIFYVIKKESKDFEKVNSLGNIVIYDSQKHLELFFASKILISTHTRGTIEPSFFDKHNAIKEYPQYYNKKYVFLQHGISISNLLTVFNKKNSINANFAKLICGALPEFRYFESNLGYKQSIVSYTGFARFDSILKQKEEWGCKNKILFMPTWRSNICSPSYKKEKIFNDYRFLKSNYYSTILNFLNSKKLNSILEKSNIELHFIPHPEVVSYLHYFTTKYKKIKIIEPSQIDIQQELIEAKLLITDYSSVFFDFAFMKKPVIFYQFDRDDFFSKHYKKGYFDFEKHYFGEVTTIEKDILSQIRKNIYTEFAFSNNAELTHREFFLKYDQNNCKRIYNEILDLI